MSTSSKPMRTAIYVRKSTESEERQVQSLDDQLAALTNLAAGEGLLVDEVFIESKSAKDPGGRPEFQRLVEKIRGGEIRVVLTWSMDRLSRNLVDGGIIAHMLQTGQLEMIRTVHRTYRPEDNAILISIENGMATSYLQDLSRNVKRGMSGKAERGWLPGRAPIGYVNNRLTHEVEPDPERFDIIRTGWHLLIRERLTPAEILRQLIKLGLTSNTRRGTGTQLSTGLLYSVFRNPFYTGQFTFRGEVWAGNHMPMISSSEFELAQECLRKSPDRRNRRYEYAYAGILRCGLCGRNVVGETKVKRLRSGDRTYVYYHCTGGNGCGRRSVTERELTQAVLKTLQRISLPDALVAEMRVGVSECFTQFNGESETRARALRSQLTAKNHHLQRTDELRLDGEISALEYRAIKDRLKSEVDGIETEIQRMEELRERTESLVNRQLLELEAVQGFASLCKDAKRAFLARIGDDHTLSDGQIRFKLNPILEQIAAFEPPRSGSKTLKAAEIRPKISNWQALSSAIGKVAYEMILREDEEMSSAKPGKKKSSPRGRPIKRNRPLLNWGVRDTDFTQYRD